MAMDDDKKPEKPQAQPAVMGYPVHHNQPYYANHYPGFPAGQNPHPITSSNAYYNYQQPPYYNHLPNEVGKTTHFGRIILILTVVVMAGMCALSMIMWLLFGNYMPRFQVSSFTLANFTATQTGFTGSWESNITVINRMEDLDAHFGGVSTLVFYREEPVGISSLEPFDLGKKQSYDLNVKVPAELLVSQEKMQNTVLPGLLQDEKNGVLVFTLRLAFKANFTGANSIYRQEAIDVYCENLIVNMHAPGHGAMNQGVGSECLVLLHCKDEASVH